MSNSKSGGRQKSLFRRNAKFDDTTLIRLVYMFCQGVSVEIAARSTKLTKKTVRAVFLEVREKLLDPEFNRWHATNTRLLKLTSPEQEALVRVTFFDVLAECYFNRSCYRNWTLGNRKTRLCRKCPQPGKFTSQEHLEDGLAMIDTIHEFYNRIGIRGEKERDPLTLFRLRLIHTTVVATTLNHSKKLKTGFVDPNDNSYLGVGTLLDKLLTNLVDKQ